MRLFYFSATNKHLNSIKYFQHILLLNDNLYKPCSKSKKIKINFHCILLKITLFGSDFFYQHHESPVNSIFRKTANNLLNTIF